MWRWAICIFYLRQLNMVIVSKTKCQITIIELIEWLHTICWINSTHLFKRMTFKLLGLPSFHSLLVSLCSCHSFAQNVYMQFIFHKSAGQQQPLYEHSFRENKKRIIKSHTKWMKRNIGCTTINYRPTERLNANNSTPI